MKAWLWNILLWIDQGLNVVAAPVLNALLKPRYRFGDPDETLSSVFGKNVRSGSCRACKWFCWLLEKIDPGHCADNIEYDEGDRLSPARKVEEN